MKKRLVGLIGAAGTILAIGAAIGAVWAQDVNLTLGPQITVVGAEGEQDHPYAAADTVNGRCLVVWAETPDFSGLDRNVRGRLVNSDGSVGDIITISDAEGQQLWQIGSGCPVGFDSVNQRYLVVWGDNRFSDYYHGRVAVCGQFISADGSLNGTNFPISPTNAVHSGGAVAFDPTNGRWFVVWTGPTAGIPRNLYGQLLNADGSKAGPMIQITAYGDDDYYGGGGANIAFDEINSRFLVAWPADLNEDVRQWRARLVGADGSLIGSEIVIRDRGDIPSGYTSTIIYNGATSGYLHVGNTTGQLLDTDGMPDGSPFTVSDPSYSTPFISGIFDPSSRRYVLVGNLGDNQTAYLLRSDGTSDGSPMLVVTNVSVGPSQPYIAFNKNTGRGIIVWEDFLWGESWGVGSGKNVYARLFNLTSVPRITAIVMLTVTNLSTTATNWIEKCDGLTEGSWEKASAPFTGASSIKWYSTISNETRRTFYRVKSQTQ